MWGVERASRRPDGGIQAWPQNSTTQPVFFAGRIGRELLLTATSGHFTPFATSHSHGDAALPLDDRLAGGHRGLLQLGLVRPQPEQVVRGSSAVLEAPESAKISARTLRNIYFRVVPPWSCTRQRLFRTNRAARAGCTGRDRVAYGCPRAHWGPPAPRASVPAVVQLQVLHSHPLERTYVTDVYVRL